MFREFSHNVSPKTCQFPHVFLVNTSVYSFHVERILYIHVFVPGQMPRKGIPSHLRLTKIREATRTATTAKLHDLLHIVFAPNFSRTSIGGSFAPGPLITTGEKRLTRDRAMRERTFHLKKPLTPSYASNSSGIPDPGIPFRSHLLWANGRPRKYPS